MLRCGYFGVKQNLILCSCIVIWNWFPLNFKKPLNTFQKVQLLDHDLEVDHLRQQFFLCYIIYNIVTWKSKKSAALLVILLHGSRVFYYSNLFFLIYYSHLSCEYTGYAIIAIIIPYMEFKFNKGRLEKTKLF